MRFPKKNEWMKRIRWTTPWFRVTLETPYNWHKARRGTLVMLALLSVLFSSGCTQWKRLIGEHDPKDSVTDVHGLWQGRMDVNGASKAVYLEIIQSGATIVEASYTGGDTSTFNVDFGVVIHSRVGGSISGDEINMTADEGSLCTNKIQLTGMVSGNDMAVTLVGPGNNIPGVNCYPNPINQQLTLKRVAA